MENNLQNEYTLTADELGLIKPLMDSVEAGQKEANTILRAISRLRNLEGHWALAGDKLVKVEPKVEPNQTAQVPAELVPANGRHG